MNNRNNGPSPENNRGGRVREQIKLEVPKRWVATDSNVDFNFPKKYCGKKNRAFQSKWFSEFPGYTIMSKAILCCVPFACNKMQNKILELPEVRESALFLKGFQTRKKRWRDSRSIKCLNATK